MANLIEMAKSYLTDSVISRISSSLDENPDNVQKALGGALPVVLGGLISRGTSPDGPNMLTGLLRQFIPIPGAAAGGLSTALPSELPGITPTETPVVAADDDDPDTLMSKGGGVLNSIFGPSSGLIGGALAQFSGVKSQSATGLMGMAGGLITSLIGRQLMGSGGGLNAGSITNLLMGQKDAVAAAMPSGLSALLGNIPGVGALTGMVGGLTGAAGSAVTGATGAMGSAIGGALGRDSKADAGDRPATERTPAYSDQPDAPKAFKFWPWLLGAAAIGLVVVLLRGCGSPMDSTSGQSDTTSASTPDATADDTSATGEMVNSMDSAVSDMGASLSGAAAALGAFGAKKLPDGVELNIPANGVENQLLAFVEDSAKPVDKTTWFNFDRLLYETGSARLKPESREQLQNMAAILKAYPAVNLKIGGYTDNTGKADANKRLSQQRADAAMAELVKLGVAADRLEAEGYGIEFPVASNDTDEGRAQNRRTAVRVTKK